MKKNANKRNRTERVIKKDKIEKKTVMPKEMGIKSNNSSDFFATNSFMFVIVFVLLALLEIF